MKRFITLVICCVFLMTSYSQVPIDLTFTAIDGADYTQLDSIKVMNRTQGGDTVLYYPDTMLSFVVTGLNEIQEFESGFKLFQNYPNPVKHQSTVTVQIPSDGKVNISVSDILGRIISQSNRELEKGVHSFNFTPGNDEIYFFTARYKNGSRSIKMLCSPSGSGNNVSLNYNGTAEEKSPLKTTSSLQSFLFNYGDELLYIGYYDTLQSGLLDSPEESDIYVFQFAYDIPCPGTPTVEYGGQTYNTVQIMSQCWLKGNLNIGNMILDTKEMSDNDTIEKYCYNNEPDSCVKYGGLYRWDEMMNYTDLESTQGICPPGWHLPGDEEWKVLEGAVDGQYNIGDPEWDNINDRGYNLGTILKTTSGWESNNNGIDLYGFSALPGGFFGSGFASVGMLGFWWMSTENLDGSAWIRRIASFSPLVMRGDAGEEMMSFSVRCLKNTNSSDNSTKLSFAAIDDADYIKLDSIRIMNRTNEGEKILYYPDTSVFLEYELPDYQEGDQLLLVGYYDTLESGILDSPEESDTYIFQFAYDIPCPGTPTVEYEGQTYNTVQIMSQCWLKENLNVGTIIPGDEDMTDNDTLEKYCYNNEQDSCMKYGGTYQWDEMMRYSTQGLQGICPPGWHIPTDEEWKLLEGVSDNQYNIGDQIWDLEDTRGFDAATNLKTTSGWDDGGNGTDLYDFSALPGGRRVAIGTFSGIGYMTPFWTSSGFDLAAWHHVIYNTASGIRRMNTSKTGGHAVRCLKD